MRKPKPKVLWIVYWQDMKTGYTEFTEVWSEEHMAIDAVNRYQEGRDESEIKFFYEPIEIIK